METSALQESNIDEATPPLPYFPSHELLITQSLKELKSSSVFSIFFVDNIRRCTPNTIRGDQTEFAYMKLCPLHCMQYAAMPLSLLAELPTYLSCATGLPANTFGTFEQLSASTTLLEDFLVRAD